MLDRFLITAAAISLLTFGASQARSGEGVARDRLEDARYTLWRMLDGRAQLVSGICDIKQVDDKRDASLVTRPREEGGRRSFQDASFDPAHVVFDFERPAYRLRQTYAGDYLVDSEFRYVAEFSTGNVNELSQPPTLGVRRYLLAETPQGRFRPFDIRTLGFSSPMDSRSTLEEMDFDAARQRYLSSRIVDFEQRDELLILTLEMSNTENPNAKWRQRFWIDPARGYTTTRIENILSSGASGLSWEMHWTEVSGTWVVQSLTVPDRLQLELTWESVNQEIPAEEFDLNQIVPEGFVGKLYRIDPFSRQQINLGTIP